MPDERSVLDHLLDGRDALQREVERLTAAIEQLDSVLGRIGSTDRSNGSNAAAPSARSEPETVNPPAEVEAGELESVPSPSPSRTAARKAPAKKAAPRVRRETGEPPKSIRVHVLDMLRTENREFGLAEIIDRVHGAGIQAHDDAVRSITIKLMKDGQVERVGRGQYRLARRGSGARASAAVASATRVTEVAPEISVDDEWAQGADSNDVTAVETDAAPQAYGATETHDSETRDTPEAADTLDIANTSEPGDTVDTGTDTAEVVDTFENAGTSETVGDSPEELVTSDTELHEPATGEFASAEDGDGDGDGDGQEHDHHDSQHHQQHDQSNEHGSGSNSERPWTPPLNLGQPWQN